MVVEDGDDGDSGVGGGAGEFGPGDRMLLGATDVPPASDWYRGNEARLWLDDPGLNWSRLGDKTTLSESSRLLLLRRVDKDAVLAAQRTREDHAIRRMLLEEEDMTALEGGVGMAFRMGDSSRWTERAKAAWWDDMG